MTVSVSVRRSSTLPPWLRYTLFVFSIISPTRQCLSLSTPKRLDNQPSRLAGVADENPGTSVGFYIHIPYCRRRCRYCNFSIVPIGKETSLSSFEVIHNQYQADILDELDMLTGETKGSVPLTLSSLYFGGGTPSLAPVSMIEEILKSIRSKFQIHHDAEITMEMDPGTFDTTQLQSLTELGVNRISLGVQSFDNNLLETMGRFHRYEDIVKAVDMIHAVLGHDANYSMDLISGVPGLTCAKWVETLKIATTRFRPAHLSVYDLQVEAGTVFGSWYDESNQKSTSRSSPRVPLPSEESVAFMYKYGAGYLRAKRYEHYEVSSYAHGGTKDRPSPLRSRHNQIYWEPSSSWYAIGLGATSFVGGELSTRPKALSDYHKWVKERRFLLSNARNDVISHPLDETMTGEDILTDIIMKRLRTSDGLNLSWIEENHGPEIRRKIVAGAALGFELNMAEMVTRGSDGQEILRLKDPEGFLYSNYIISSIFAELGYE